MNRIGLPRYAFISASRSPQRHAVPVAATIFRRRATHRSDQSQTWHEKRYRSGRRFQESEMGVLYCALGRTCVLVAPRRYAPCNRLLSQYLVSSNQIRSLVRDVAWKPVTSDLDQYEPSWASIGFHETSS